MQGPRYSWSQRLDKSATGVIACRMLAEEFLSATNSGFAMVTFELHWAIARAMLRVVMAE
jgi:hypothetical protein